MRLKDCFRRLSVEKMVMKRYQEKRSIQIEQQCRKPVKILLLGAGESGKTTIIKQMQILHVQDGFSYDERLDKLHDIIENIHESIYELVRQVIFMDLQFDSIENRNHADKILRMGNEAPWNLCVDYVHRVKSLWSDMAIKTCYKRSNEFQLMDSAKYFLDRVERLSIPGYIPTNSDILNCRKTTTGIQEINFHIPMPKSLGGGCQEFRMFDVGGQRAHRTKWMQIFEDIEVVLFMIECSSFDQTLREDPGKNRLVESFDLFRGVWQNRFLAEAGLIVFLNKQDILAEKIRAGKSIKDYFAEFDDFVVVGDDEDGIDGELARTRRFIMSRLVDITNEQPRRTSHLVRRNRSCYYHFTVATDTQNVRNVFNDVHNIILTRNLEDFSVS
ncbi:guanine nucleotide-binding protein G(f) subunit alpha [Toxorhynchites rutilus septentrionalis]|uniref:guanine nucleotide-binding protein G(f) subunit alpha n=1 Tax=Toxorhynchites rutilus septentrionalis TaxID=329112 RepID=UPI00247AB950|nr:guanine nucleotide-binding protein G(f) subunit alpha [Toxorhynchites rutilus septentrionalis]XP_055629545.1 guanine nucleotide-binding protein G(f) subunit alpha [Toxorhynchites rutilus septentrionalis]XP_055629546.1 guanine nucleotide-binding protein G(f) subunit alpha [Toxorhynchites rutilus septentrionalis]XP_055629547.1 guanine nucleotide-binding protein G(f) subunit alpha [Toxorhynchites rutilus septentrionalis]